VLYLGDRKPAERLTHDVAALTNDSPEGRAEVRQVETPPIVGFRIPLSVQPSLIDTFVDWLDAELPAPGRLPAQPVNTTG
jgi:hypothetical protein